MKLEIEKEEKVMWYELSPSSSDLYIELIKRAYNIYDWEYIQMCRW